MRLQAQADARTAGEVQTAWLKANLAPHFTQKLLRVVRDILKWVAAHDGEPRHQFPLLAGSHLTEVCLASRIVPTLQGLHRGRLAAGGAIHCSGWTCLLAHSVGPWKGLRVFPGVLPGCQLSAVCRRVCHPPLWLFWHCQKKQIHASLEAVSCATPSAGAVPCHTRLPMKCMPAADWAPLGFRVLGIPKACLLLVELDTPALNMQS